MGQPGPTWGQLRPAWANMSQRGPTWGQLKAIMDEKIIEKQLFFLGFFDTSRKSSEALGNALGEPLGTPWGNPWERLGEPLGTPGEALGTPGEALGTPPGGQGVTWGGQTARQASTSRSEAGPKPKWPPNQATDPPGFPRALSEIILLIYNMEM